MKDMFDLMEELSGEDNPPEFNNGECKKTCNCIEIEQHKQGGEIKNGYPCLQPDAKAIIQKMADKSGITYDEMLKKLEDFGKKMEDGKV